MGFTDAAQPAALVVHLRSRLPESAASAAGLGRAGIAAAPRFLGGTAARLPHAAAGIFSGLSASGFANTLAKVLLSGFFHTLSTWVASGAASIVGGLGAALSSTTQPVLSGGAWGSEFDIMAVLSAAVALPLVAAGAIQAIVRQEPGGLLRSVLVRLPLALLFTGVSVQLVVLGLEATDQASAMLLGATGDPAHRLLTGLATGLGQPGDFGLAAFGGFLVVLSAAVVAFMLWLELAVRSAAIAAASLFLPLALVGLAWPATSQWARRLGETLAALVLSKLVIAAVLALAASLLLSPSGVSSTVEGVALLAIAAFSPFALLRLVPAIEAGAAGHLEGLGRRGVRGADRLGTELGITEAGTVAAMAGLGATLMSRGANNSGGGTPSTGGSGPGAEPWANLNVGPWTADRPKYAAADDGASGAQSSPDPGGPAAPSGSRSQIGGTTDHG